jgi:hypothetical protein
VYYILDVALIVRSPAAIVGSNPTGNGCLSVVCVVYSQVEVSAKS